MSFGSRHNKVNPFQIDTKDYEFKKLNEFEVGRIFHLSGFYINKKSKYGPSPVAIISDEKILLNLPNHKLEEVEDILKSEEDITDIKNGVAGLQIYEYSDDNGEKHLSVGCVDYK